jgi:hypothetical protein
VLQLVLPALGRQEDPGDALVVGVHLPPDGARLLEPLKDARDPGPRQVQCLGEVLLAHALARREQSQTHKFAVISATIAQVAPNRLAVKVEQPSQGMKGLQSLLIDSDVLGRMWCRSMICGARHVLCQAPSLVSKRALLITSRTVLRKIIGSSRPSIQVTAQLRVDQVDMSELKALNIEVD